MLGLIISIGVSFLYAGSLNKNDEINLKNSSIAIFDRNNEDVSAALKEYLASEMNIVSVSNTQKAIDDALYFEEADYILIIPESFSADLVAGKTLKLNVQVRPNSYSKTLIDASINHFLNTFKTYQQTMPELSTAELLDHTKENLAVKGEVALDDTYAEQVHREATAGVFDLLSYGMFTAVFSGIACIYLAFNRKEIRARNLCSPKSQKQLTMQIFLGGVVYCLAVFAVFIGYNLIYTRSGLNGYTGFFLLNALLFFLVMITFSLMICSLAKNPLIISIVNNTFILGSCFISGVFVPSEYLPDIVIKFSMLTPTYWFTATNRLIADASRMDSAFYQSLGFSFVILLCFSIAFLVINRVRQIETGGLKKSKRAVMQ